MNHGVTMGGIGQLGNTILMRHPTLARLAQSAERKALNLVVVGSSPTVGASSLPARLLDGRDLLAVATCCRGRGPRRADGPHPAATAHGNGPRQRAAATCYRERDPLPWAAAACCHRQAEHRRAIWSAQLHPWSSGYDVSLTR